MVASLLLVLALTGCDDAPTTTPPPPAWMGVTHTNSGSQEPADDGGQAYAAGEPEPVATATTTSAVTTSTSTSTEPIAPVAALNQPAAAPIAPVAAAPVVAPVAPPTLAEADDITGSCMLNPNGTFSCTPNAIDADGSIGILLSGVTSVKGTEYIRISGVAVGDGIVNTGYLVDSVGQPVEVKYLDTVSTIAHKAVQMKGEKGRVPDIQVRCSKNLLGDCEAKPVEVVKTTVFERTSVDGKVKETTTFTDLSAAPAPAPAPKKATPKAPATTPAAKPIVCLPAAPCGNAEVNAVAAPATTTASTTP